MRVRLRGRQPTEALAAPAPEGPPARPAAAGPAVSHRRFLKVLGAAVGVAGVGQLLAAPRAAEAGTVNRVAKYISSQSLGDSQITDTGASVGIGTTSPTVKLEVDDTIKVGQTTGNGDAWVRARANPSTNAATLFISGGKNGVWNSTADPTHGAMIACFSNGSFNAGRLQLWGGGSSGYVEILTGNVSRAVVDANGNLGIGTASPSARLHLSAGSIKIGARTIADDGGCYYA